ncbi:MAG: hypothetical protein WCX22_04720 [Methanoregula sp.]
MRWTVAGAGNSGVKRSALALAILLVVVLLLVAICARAPHFTGIPNSTGQSAILPVTAPGSNGTIHAAEPQAAPGSSLTFPEENRTGLVTRSFPYVLRGETGTVNASLSSAMYSELAAEVPPEMCSPDNATVPCTHEVFSRFYLNMVNEPDENGTLDALVDAIREKTPVRDDQARIAISLVQQIPYGYHPSSGGGNGSMRYPVMILSDDNGLCDEKAVLLASLLQRLGYGTALLDFSSDNHMVLGIQSPAAYAYNNSGYAFVETTIPLIVTDDQEFYNGGGRLAGVPDIYPVSDGASFDSVSEEYLDAREFIRLTKSGRYTGSGLRASDDPVLQPLVQKYGLNLSQAA